MKRDRNRLIEDFTTLLEVPEVEKILRNKVEELKIRYKESFSELEEITDLFKTENKITKIQETSFEIVRKEIGWIPIIPDQDEPYKIIPKKVFDEIIKASAEVGTIIMNYPIKIPGGRHFEATFEKSNEIIYTGTIVEKKRESKFKKSETINLHENMNLPETKTELLKLMLNYLLTHESFYDYIITDFTVRWKPLLDSGLLQTGSKIS